MGNRSVLKLNFGCSGPELLAALATSVRVFSFAQVVSGFFEGREARAKRYLNGCTERGYLLRQRVLARQLPIPSEPLFTWGLGEHPPQYNYLVYSLRRRWLDVPAKLTTVYLQGPLTAKMFGTKCLSKLPHVLQASHDLGLSGVYLAFRTHRPKTASRWIGEDIGPKSDGQIADAIILGLDGKALLAIEYGGLYSEIRLKRFHADCVKKDLPYELW